MFKSKKNLSGPFRILDIGRITSWCSTRPESPIPFPRRCAAALERIVGKTSTGVYKDPVPATKRADSVGHGAPLGPFRILTHRPY